MEWLQLPHWLMIAGTLLVIAGLIGLVISRRQQAKVQGDPANEPSPEPRPQLPPLPDLLDFPATKKSAVTLIGKNATGPAAER